MLLYKRRIEGWLKIIHILFINIDRLFLHFFFSYIIIDAFYESPSVPSNCLNIQIKKLLTMVTKFPTRANSAVYGVSNTIDWIDANTYPFNVSMHRETSKQSLLILARNVISC